MIGVAATFEGTTYRRLADPAEISDIVSHLWGSPLAWQLAKVIEATANALSSGTSLPTGISSQLIPIVRGDNPVAILDRLWLSGPANSILHKKKPLLLERHDISAEDVNSLLTEQKSPEQNNHGQ
ncbi:hypothetical protein BUE93_05665 [Chromobacterium amazonense]|uniref:Uncharacterized protein n=2 Tax=Chromobacterium amazonense TaxID=1382803 RepID=A0A2S9X712_9NEIS|nr:hypothetical protein BUE93_05665 [Chromobacterium amazonense]